MIHASYGAEHLQLMEEIQREINATNGSLGFERLSPPVWRALRKVPRHLFVPPNEKEHAYINDPVPIGEGQTISQPFLVAIMTELLKVAPTDKVLEIGTGSGYQAAILSYLAREVFTVEVRAPLARQAARNLKGDTYAHVHIALKDGPQGWPEHAPYHKIIVTAAAAQIPPDLLNQLAPCGRMILPLGTMEGPQMLTLIKKDADDHITQQSVLSVRFVPLTSMIQ